MYVRPAWQYLFRKSAKLGCWASLCFIVPVLTFSTPQTSNFPGGVLPLPYTSCRVGGVGGLFLVFCSDFSRPRTTAVWRSSLSKLSPLLSCGLLCENNDSIGRNRNSNLFWPISLGQGLMCLGLRSVVSSAFLSPPPQHPSSSCVYGESWAGKNFSSAGIADLCLVSLWDPWPQRVSCSSLSLNIFFFSPSFNSRMFLSRISNGGVFCPSSSSRLLSCVAWCKVCGGRYGGFLLFSLLQRNFASSFLFASPYVLYRPGERERFILPFPQGKKTFAYTASLKALKLCLIPGSRRVCWLSLSILKVLLQVRQGIGKCWGFMPRHRHG